VSDIHVWTMAHFEGSAILQLGSVVLAFAVILSLFGLIALIFVPLGQAVGWYLEHAPNGVRAYSLNVAASLAGIWLYTMLCFFWSPPLVWVAIFSVGLVLYVWKLPVARTASIVTSVVMMGMLFIGLRKIQWWAGDWKGTRTELLHGMQAGHAERFWSPYQKLTMIPMTYNGVPVSFLLNTNDSWYQQMWDLSDSTVHKYPELYADKPVEFHQYNLPYRFYPRPPRVLIAGAGAGNDASGAVRNGAGSVTAVEIDPLIIDIGRRRHFEHPYAQDKVKVVIDDARSYIQNSREQYDLIIFSILDSHTTSSYYTNIRLDNYVYTVEALRQVRRLLAPDGLFVMSFSASRPWFAGRLKAIVTEAFGAPPLTLQSDSYYFIAGSPQRIQAALAADPSLNSFVTSRLSPPIAAATVSTDDWPYLYQQFRTIPSIVWLLSAGLVLISAIALRRFKKSDEPFMWHFFFLGAAFMLLEVQIISKTALLFGTTWLVNSIVITALLVFVLLANVVVEKVKVPRQVAYVGLFLTLALAYFVPAESLFFSSKLVRGLAVAVVYCSPCFFAGLVFIGSFRAIGFRAEAFGANLLGSLVGGLLESASYATGIKALVIMAAVLYVASLVTAGKTIAAATRPLPGGPA
jgi:SAM-dependent methyltransferase